MQIATVAEIDKPGIHVAGISNTTTIRAMAAWLSNTAPKGVPTVDAAIDQLKSGEIDAFGMSRDALVALSAAVPGSHVLPGQTGPKSSRCRRAASAGTNAVNASQNP
jgi:ABC-type amino acid transport substrate-binding protein